MKNISGFTVHTYSFFRIEANQRNLSIQVQYCLTKQTFPINGFAKISPMESPKNF